MTKPKKKAQEAYVLTRPPESLFDKDPSQWTKAEEAEHEAFAEGFLRAILEAPPPSAGFLAWQVSKKSSGSRAALVKLESLVEGIQRLAARLFRKGWIGRGHPCESQATPPAG